MDNNEKNVKGNNSSYDLLKKRLDSVKGVTVAAPPKKVQENIKRPIKPSPAPVTTEKNQKNKKKDTTIKIMVVVAAVLLAWLVVGVSMVFMIKFNVFKPSVKDPGSRETVNPAIIGSESGEESDTYKPAVDPSSVQRKDNCYNFLVLGKDNVALNTDVIFIASYDVNASEINIIQIPRDTYVEIQGKSMKINSTYARMVRQARNNGAEDIEMAALADTAAVFEANMNVAIDYYALLNLSGLGNMVDIIGGVPINVPYDLKYSDPYQDLYIDIQAGPQVFDGAKAQQFLRFRSGYLNADIGRIDAQKIFMSALCKQIKNNINVSTLVGMLNTLTNNLRTNITIADLTYFVKSFYSVPDQSIRFVTFPGSATMYQKLSYYVMKKADLVNLMNTYFNVTTAPITMDTFDPYKIFVNEGADTILGTYNSPAEDITQYVRTSQDIDNNGIYIPVKKS